MGYICTLKIPRIFLFFSSIYLFITFDNGTQRSIAAPPGLEVLKEFVGLEMYNAGGFTALSTRPASMETARKDASKLDSHRILGEHTGRVAVTCDLGLLDLVPDLLDLLL